MEIATIAFPFGYEGIDHDEGIPIDLEKNIIPDPIPLHQKRIVLELISVAQRLRPLHL